MGNRTFLSIRLAFIALLITAQVLLINYSVFAAVNTRLVFVSNQYNFPSVGKGTLILDMEARSDAGTVEIRQFENECLLDAAFLAQKPGVGFSDEYFGFELTPPIHVYTQSQSFSGGTGRISVRYRFLRGFPQNEYKTIGTGYQRIVRFTIEYDLGAAIGSISWSSGFRVLDPNNTDITGIQEPIPPELTDISLPVELTSFTATAAENKVVLAWITQSEINNQGFEVYRSTEQGGEYSLLASYEDNESLQGAGNSNIAREYTYEDYLINAGETYWYQIADVDYQGIRTFHGPVSIEYPELVPEAYILHPNYPNPFNPETNIRFEIPENPANSQVKLVIYNNLGMEVRTLINETVEPGVHTLQWDGRNNYGEQMASGVYFLHLQVGTFAQTQKMALLR